MASFVVDGLVVPVSVAGHPALDFCNTRAGWAEPAPKEYLHTHAHLSVWARENGLVQPASMAALTRAAAADPTAAADVVARAVALRSALYAVLVGPATECPLGRGEPRDRCRRRGLGADPWPARHLVHHGSVRRGPTGAGRRLVRGVPAELACGGHRAGVPRRRMRLVVRRSAGAAAVVLDGLVRQPRQGPPPRPAPPPPGIARHPGCLRSGRLASLTVTMSGRSSDMDHPRRGPSGAVPHSRRRHPLRRRLMPPHAPSLLELCGLDRVRDYGLLMVMNHGPPTASTVSLVEFGSTGCVSGLLEFPTSDASGPRSVVTLNSPPP